MDTFSILLFRFSSYSIQTHIKHIICERNLMNNGVDRRSKPSKHFAFEHMPHFHLIQGGDSGSGRRNVG